MKFYRRVDSQAFDNDVNKISERAYYVIVSRDECSEQEVVFQHCFVVIK